MFNIEYPIWIVRVETIRKYDECGYSFLPYCDEIFGVFINEEQAVDSVWRSFSENEWICDNNIIDDIASGCDELFSYKDETYGGIAYYAVYYHKEWIRKPIEHPIINYYEKKEDYNYINQFKLQAWKELETERYENQIKCNKELPNITNEEIDNKVEEILKSKLQ